MTMSLGGVRRVASLTIREKRRVRLGKPFALTRYNERVSGVSISS